MSRWSCTSTQQAAILRYERHGRSMGGANEVAALKRAAVKKWPP
jgi:hypothetical protein